MSSGRLEDSDGATTVVSAPDPVKADARDLDTQRDAPDSFEALLAAAVCPPDDLPSAPALAEADALASGTWIAARFVVEQLAGSGGMGAVYRCRDELTQRPVALKVLRGVGEQYASRFRREASVLSSLMHPAIVRYVTHGSTDDGMPYLAMEWLHGEDLAERLRQGRLTVAQSVTLARRLCEGIAAAHARGFLHRDIKPSNVFLVDREVGAAKLLDFGLAHRRAATQTLTRAGTILGTVGYMAPEQATGAGVRDLRGDLFSIGCVLYECLTGSPAFSGENHVAVLDKVLRTEPPRVSTLREGVTPELDALLVSLLWKTPDGRPQDAASVARALRVIEAGGRLPVEASQRKVADPLRPPPVLEVVVAIGGNPEQSLDALAGVGDGLGLRSMQVPDRSALLLRSVREASLHLLDKAEHALRCALRLKRSHPHLAIALATGLTDERAGCLAGAAPAWAAVRVGEGASMPWAVVVDALTLALLEPVARMAWTALPDGAAVSALYGDADTVPPEHESDALLGRDKELRLLEATLTECVADSVARVVLITGEAKMGKTRLFRAFAARIRARAEAAVVVVRADAAEREEPYALLRKLVGDPLAPLSSPTRDAHAREALLAWVQSRCADGPLVLVLEDLQWGDLASIGCLGACVVAAAEQPLLVLGLTRPDARTGARASWHDPQEVSLRGLTDRAAERLVTRALGEHLDRDDVARMLRLAEGRPLVLAQLTRAGAAWPALPAAAIALAQEQLASLAPPLLRVLRAASAFHVGCRARDLSAVLGDDPSHLRESLHRLVQEGLLVEHVGSDMTCPSRYEFQSELTREAARGLLRDDELHAMLAPAVRGSVRSAGQPRADG
jgi:eukaryotic-like serine/threonine-protein kinase